MYGLSKSFEKKKQTNKQTKTKFNNINIAFKYNNISNSFLLILHLLNDRCASLLFVHTQALCNLFAHIQVLQHLPSQQILLIT